MGTRPCPACGEAVDPLRAPRVLAHEDGFRYFCGEECVSAYRQGERAYHSPWEEERSDVYGPKRSKSDRPRGQEAPKRPEATQTRIVHGPFGITDVSFPVTGSIAAAVATLVGAIPGSSVFAMVSVLGVVVAAGAALRASADTVKRAGTLVWIAAPMGALLASVAALIARLEDPSAWWGLTGAGIAASSVVLRAWLDGRSRQPVAAAVHALAERIPRRTRIPIHEGTLLEVSEAEVATDRIRAGEEILVHRGEVVAVDGVVKAGEAQVLLYPGARTPVARTVNDSLLAGARVVDGAVRLLTTRVGDDRALLRPPRFGAGSGPGSARVARRAELAARWGGVVAVAVAVGGLGIVEGDGHAVAVPLSAAAAVLLGAPLLAARRAAEAPLVAAAAAAAERGIIYQDARTLETTGRVTACALCAHGAVTEGAPEVVQVHPIGGFPDVKLLIALAAAAETAAEGSAIAGAIRRYAERKEIAPESVRRATYLPGRGVTALGPGGEGFVIGNRQLLLEEGVSVAIADEQATLAEARGYTALFVGLGGRVRAVISLQDQVRPGARAAVQRIVDLHVEPILLSGDHRGTVETLARNLDVGHVKAELLPEERGAEVRRLREAGGVVAVVGHARLDDAALSAADVALVLSAAGGPGGESGVALSADDIRDAADAMWIAKAARAEAWRGVLLAVGAGSLVIAGAAIGFVPPAFAALLGVGVDLVTLPSGARLLSRIALRCPLPP